MDGTCVWYFVTNDGGGWGRPIATAHKAGFNIKGPLKMVNKNLSVIPNIKRNILIFSISWTLASALICYNLKGGCYICGGGLKRFCKILLSGWAKGSGFHGSYATRQTRCWREWSCVRLFEFVIFAILWFYIQMKWNTQTFARAFHFSGKRSKKIICVDYHCKA